MNRNKILKAMAAILIVLLLMASALAAESEVAVDSDGILERLCEANTMDAILMEHENYTTRITVLDSDGNETLNVEAFVGVEHCSYVLQMSDYVNQWAFRDGEGYAASSDPAEGAGKYLFMGYEAYAPHYEYYSQMCAGLMYPLENEEVISAELNAKGQLVIASRTLVDGLGEMGYPDAADVESTYIVDPESYQIEGGTVTILDAAGNVLGRQTAVRMYNVAESTVLDELCAQIEGGEQQRTVTAVDVVNGINYSVTINQGMDCYLVPVEGAVLYSDEACTVEWVENADRNADLTLYAKY